MPTYDYLCEKCEGSVAVVRKITQSDVPPTEQEVTSDFVASEDTSKIPCTKGHTLKRYHKQAPTFKLQGYGWFNSGGY